MLFSVHPLVKEVAMNKQTCYYIYILSLIQKCKMYIK